MKTKLIFLVWIFFANTAIAASFPAPVAATFYPIYNSGIEQYVVPNLDMPFDKVSALFVAFAHTYPNGDGATLKFEDTQPDEVNRLPLLVKTARQVNPNIKVLISMGWEHNDWKYINTDYVTHANQFIPSVINFIRTHDLDGFDIFEDINGSASAIPQKNFDAVIKNLKLALVKAGNEDNKIYYLTITPAYGRANVDTSNMNYFDLINTQNYRGSYPSDFTAIGYPAKQITQGLHVYYECDSTIPSAQGFAGIFSWNMTADIACQNYYTYKIAEVVGYPGVSRKHASYLKN